MTWLAGLDPGGMKLARAVHILLAIVISATAGWQMQVHLAVPAGTSLAIIAPFVGAHAMMFAAPGSRRAEAVEILGKTAIALAVFALAAAVGWGDLGFGHIALQYAWVVAIAFGFYLRRYGPAGFRAGMALSLSFMIVVIMDPTRAAAAWWLPAAAVGGLAAAAVALLAWRPSAMRVFQRQQREFLAAVLHALKTRRGKGAAGPDADAIASPMRHTRQRWEAMAATSTLAAGRHPADRQRIETILTAALRMDFALRVVEEDDGNALRDATPGSELEQAIARTIDLLTSGTRDAATIQASVDGLRAARDAIVARHDQDDRERFFQARMTTALLSLVLGYQGVQRADGDDGQDPAARQRSQAAASGGARTGPHSFGLRLALQGFVATGITTAIGQLFHLDHAYWATLTVVVVIGASVGATVRRTIERALGTAIGVFLAIAVLWLSGESRAVQFALIVAAFIPTFVLMERYYLPASCMIGFMVVGGLHLLFGLSAEEMLSRAYDTAIGASIGLAVAASLVP
ncbi:MAG: FUSC family protein, partial [Chromatiales bacterium]